MILHTIHLQHSYAYWEGAMPQKMWTLQNKCQLFISDDLDPVHFVLKVVSMLQVQKFTLCLSISGINQQDLLRINAENQLIN